MPDRIVLSIDLTLEEHQQINDLARRRGYETPADYVRALIEFDVETHGESTAADAETDLTQHFRRSLQDAIQAKPTRFHPSGTA
jgi:Arc/MetJ-type ribon-helix-helix transcriptional regulator